MLINIQVDVNCGIETKLNDLCGTLSNVKSLYNRKTDVMMK